jgi:hypothetical protein
MGKRNLAEQDQDQDEVDFQRAIAGKHRNLAEVDAEMEAEIQRRIAGSRAAAERNRRRKEAETFVKVPLWWIDQAAKLTRSPTTLVLIELLHAKFRARSSTFTLSNARLRKLGVNRDTKSRILRDLASGKGKMITLEQKPGRAPQITLIGY